MYRKNAIVLTKVKSIQRKHIKKNKTIQNDEILVEKNGPLCYNSKEVLTIRGDFAMASKKRNIIVGQSGGPTSVINSSLAGVYKTAKERGFHKVYGMLHGIQGFLDEQYVDLSSQIHSDMDIELLKRTPSAFLGSCRYKLPEIHENPEIYEKIFTILDKLNIEVFI